MKIERLRVNAKINRDTGNDEETSLYGTLYAMEKGPAMEVTLI